MDSRTRIPAFIIFLTALSALAPRPALAWPPTYGLEFNLRSEGLEEAWASRVRKLGQKGQAPTKDGEHRIATELMEKLRKACLPECVVREEVGKFEFLEWKFSFPSGFSFNLSVDPATVEFQLGPWDLETWRRHGPEIQKWLFDFPKSAGFSYKALNASETSAHLNIGARSAFGEDGKAMARFLADYWEHPELGSGVLGNDSFNAPLLGDLSIRQQTSAKRTIESLNHLPKSPQDLARRIEASTYMNLPPDEPARGAFHYQAIGLKYVSIPDRMGQNLKDTPFELRANRQPLSSEQAILQLELQERRLAYLKTLESQPLALDLSLVVPNRGISLSASRDRVTGFYVYLDEMGLADQFEKYRVLMDPELASVEPHAFVRGKMDWSDPSAVESLERLSVRVRRSSSVRRILKEALQAPGASRALPARVLLSRLGDQAVQQSAAAAADSAKTVAALDGLKGGPNPGADPLCAACLEVVSSPEWRDDEEFKRMARKLAGKSPTQMKVVPNFWSACQAMFGLKAYP